MELTGMFLPMGKYINDVFTDGTGVSVEKDELSKEQLALLEKIVRDEGVGSVDLKRDKRILDTYGDGFEQGFDHLTTSYGQLRNTLGGFNVTQNEEGEYIVNDTYDWTHDYKDMGYTGDALNMLGKIAYEHGGTKQGKGKPYQINLGKLPKKGMLRTPNL